MHPIWFWRFSKSKLAFPFEQASNLIQTYLILYKQVNPENSLWKTRTFCLTSYPDKETILYISYNESLQLSRFIYKRFHLPRAGLSNENVDIDKGRDVFSKTISDNMRIELESTHTVTYNQKIWFEASCFPFQISRPLDISRFS